MGYSIKQLSVASLLLDPANPRLLEVQQNQQATQLALAKLVGTQIVNIAEDISTNGLDPTTLTAVVKDSESKRRFRVLEGNRRLLAIKALETPAIVEGALSPSLQRRLAAASAVYNEAPISRITCVVFDDPDDAWYWIELRHTGENGGVGLVRWGTNEQDRFRSRNGGAAARKPAGQILDFVDSIEKPPEGANSKILTNLQRLISTRSIREILGIETDRGVVYSWYPRSEVYKGLRKAVNDLRGETKVGDIYYEENRREYIKGYTQQDLPDPATRLTERTSLSALPDEAHVANADGAATSGGADSTVSGSGNAETSTEASPTVDPLTKSDAVTLESGTTGNDQSIESSATPAVPTGATRSRAKPRAERETVVPRGCALFISDGRTNLIYEELRNLPVDQYANGCAVLLRVFVELSIDAYIVRESLMTEAARSTTPLAKRLKATASHLKTEGEIDAQLEKAVIKVADGSGPFGTSTTTFNQYVHNRFVFPKASEIRLAWDELEPTLKAIWKR